MCKSFILRLFFNVQVSAYLGLCVFLFSHKKSSGFSKKNWEKAKKNIFFQKTNSNFSKKLCHLSQILSTFLSISESDREGDLGGAVLIPNNFSVFFSVHLKVVFWELTLI